LYTGLDIETINLYTGFENLTKYSHTGLYFIKNIPMGNFQYHPTKLTYSNNMNAQFYVYNFVRNYFFKPIQTSLMLT